MNESIAKLIRRFSKTFNKKNLTKQKQFYKKIKKEYTFFTPKQRNNARQFMENYIKEFEKQFGDLNSDLLKSSQDKIVSSLKKKTKQIKLDFSEFVKEFIKEEKK